MQRSDYNMPGFGDCEPPDDDYISPRERARLRREAKEEPDEPYFDPRQADYMYDPIKQYSRGNE